MGIILKNDEQRSRLQQKITKDLQEKAKNKYLDPTQPDGVDDSRYIEDTKVTTSLAWVWVLITIAVIALIIFAISKAYA